MRIRFGLIGAVSENGLEGDTVHNRNLLVASNAINGR
jgi:hypothetical protein